MNWLFSTDGFASKATCGPDWSTGLLAMYGLANAASFCIYQVFPVLVLIYLYPRHLKIVRPALRALIIFVATCGLTHLAEAATIWWPAYRIVTAVHCLNVLTSFTGAVLLVAAIEKLRFVPIRSDLENQLVDLQEAIRDLRESANQVAVSSGTAAALEKLKAATAALRESCK